MMDESELSPISGDLNSRRRRTKTSCRSPLARLAAVAALGVGLAASVCAQTQSRISTDPETVAQVKRWNAECLQCHIGDTLRDHSKGLFAIPKPGEGIVRESPRFAASNHGAMACKTCHVGAYTSYPHEAEEISKKARTLPCDECHAQESFRVEAQVAKSVHSKNLARVFTCNTCHDAHVAASAKKLGNTQTVVAQDNAMCLDCHHSEEKFKAFGGKLLPEKKRPDLDKIHDWLPNTQRHWQSARCIDCHTPPPGPKSALSVSHEILGKDKARKTCTHCHSPDSALCASLYRHVKESDARTYGFVNAAFLRSAYVVGATRNTYLDLLALLMVGGTLAGIGLHGALRWVANRRRRTS